MDLYWSWFAEMDRLRRLQGSVLDGLGLGPRETPFDVIHERPGLRLRRYGAGAAGRAPLLIVPAPIKRPYIWDLTPRRSVVRRALERGLGVYLVEWTEPGAGPDAPGLAAYAGAMLDGCIGALGQVTGSPRAFLAGHSLGGLFAALHSAWRPAHAAALVLVDAPLHFGGAASGEFRYLPALADRLRAALAADVPVPGSLLSVLSAATAPATFCTSRYADCLASMLDPGRSATHWQVERWTLDELPMSRKLLDDLVDELYRHDRFMRGQFMLDAQRLGPGDVGAPLLSVVEPGSGIAPAESVLAFHRAAASADKLVLEYGGDTGVALQHVGPLVGENAHRELWPRVFDWLARLA